LGLWPIVVTLPGCWRDDADGLVRWVPGLLEWFKKALEAYLQSFST
jgi:hypothetical protein